MKPKFERRHYVALARWLAETGQPHSLASSLADTLAGYNPRFDRRRFLTAAAGVKEDRARQRVREAA